jgi:regulator of protease activity HflC (stomatin/prohibitin superfamily)
LEANTRDGIPIQTSVSVLFRVKQVENGQIDESLPHPYDKDAVFSVIYASSIDELDTVRPWKEQLCPRAAALLVNEISKYTLNQLYQSDESALNVFETIKQQVKQELERDALRDGIEVINVSFGRFELPPGVTEQRIRTWQADWKRRIKEQQASSNVLALRRIKEARARAQVEIIENIAQNIHDMRQSGDSDLTEIIMMRMIEALEKALSDESLQPLLPHRLMTQMMIDSSAKLQEWVDQPSQREQS